MLSRPSAASVLRSLLPAVLLLGACQSGETKKPAPPPASSSSATAGSLARAEISSEFDASAEVTAIEREQRVVTLRREDGSLFKVRCGDAVRNFDQIAVGNALRVRYKAVLAASELPPGEKARGAQASLAAARAKPGSQPAAGVGVGISVRVKIESIDSEHGIVVFSLASGELIAHRIQTSEGRRFIEAIAVGDGVQLDYGEALALGVEKL